MAEREKKWNPCRHCEGAHESHVVVDGIRFCPGSRSVEFEEQRIFRASPSSVKTFQGCIRKWAAKALGGVKKEETEAQRFGTKLHEYAEKYLLTGDVPDQTTPEGRLMVEGIPFLPRRRLLPEEVEGEISFEFGGVPWIGYYDWRENDIHLIGDHKSSADPKKWGLTTKDLPDDIQAGMYAYGSGWPETSLKWVYYGKKTKTAYPVEARITAEHARQVVEAHAPVAREMQRWFNEYPEPQSIHFLNTIPNDPSTCGGCGRNCDFADSCQLFKPQETVTIDPERSAKMNDKIAELKAKIEAKKNGTQVNPPEAAAALEETKKEVKNDPSDPPENPDAKKKDPPAAAEEKKEEEAKPKAAKEPKPKIPAGPAVAGDIAAFLAALPKGATVTVQFTVA